MTERKTEKIIVEHHKDTIEIVGYLAMSIILVILFLYSASQITALAKEVAQLKAEVTSMISRDTYMTDLKKQMDRESSVEIIPNKEEVEKMEDHLIYSPSK